MYRNGKTEGVAQQLEAILTSVIAVFFIIAILIYLIQYICDYFNSRTFKKKTVTPRYPHWLSGNLCAPQLHEPVYPIPEFCVFMKDYIMKTWNNKGKVQEKDKKIVTKLRNVLGKLFNLTVDSDLFPDSTCIISIPKSNFRNGSMPELFIPIHGGPPDDSHYEFQMIGDDRIQITYYVVDGVSYVAGICIYVENPYQERVHYNGTMILKLILDTPEYWSKWDLQEEKVDIVREKGLQRYFVATRNRYGEEKSWKFNEEEKVFESCGRCHNSDWELIEEGDPRILAMTFSVKMCKSQKEMVMIAEKYGRKCHVIWNKRVNKMELFDCTTCEQLQEAPPPSYKLAVCTASSRGPLKVLCAVH
ncbi:hypothetical protein CRE_28202 [Caenorhabditis remanei]|uniref:Uncharacterized protein n=1 Tax=Caenorhabditis remanei TaxID=31234 RepID=E3LMV0_CAERE|nr:hypothetical protein CRE_28202 [Caenorhabditis remanei]